MLTLDELDALRTGLADDPDRQALLATLRARAAPLLDRAPPIPRVKALLSRDGGFCPRDGAVLRFDPWSPDRHQCPRCGEWQAGARHHRHWARGQHLWLSERAAELAMISVITDDDGAAARSSALLEGYEDLYFELPNRDNVLGPTHLFFSTYLESMWITSYLAAAFLLRRGDRLPAERIEGIDRVAEEAAGVIGEFDEGLSNRQTWHAAALTAIAAWFGDEDLARSAIESRTGLVGHLTDGFGGDGLWWEGENYHLFALRGLMLGMHWARALGVDLLEHAELHDPFREALRAPSRTALPDLTYPARRDARYGVSLAQPAFLELWEIGRAWLPDDELTRWLAALYAAPSPSAEHSDAWLHDAGRPAPARRTRGDLSWWAMAGMGTPLPPEPRAGRPASGLLADQGLGVLRNGGPDRYASLECGPVVGGHGHPDRLHLTLHAGGVHWLPDQGTGSYVRPDLAWYRSDLAHNAPLLDGDNAGGRDAWCEAFDEQGDWGWCRGRAGTLCRTIVTGPGHLVDVLERESAESGLLELPWHLAGEGRVVSSGRWEPATLEHRFVSAAERFVPDAEGPLILEFAAAGAGLRVFFLAPQAELLRARGPGLPTEPDERTFYVLRRKGGPVGWATVLDSTPAGDRRAVTAVVMEDRAIELSTAAGPRRYEFGEAGLVVEDEPARVALGGTRPAPRAHAPLLRDRSGPDVLAVAPHLAEPPTLDGSLEGFDLAEPIQLDSELQYRRSETPYDGERFSAEAWVNRDVDGLYVAVEVRKPETIFRRPDAAPLELDNEPDDIHSDGLQLYVRHDGGFLGFLIVPAPDGSLVVRRLTDDGSRATVSGGWQAIEGGYRVTLGLNDRMLGELPAESRVGFDLLVNEMQPDRLRRAGQLVWSGAGGWVYLRGDRHDAARLGTLELA